MVSLHRENLFRSEPPSNTQRLFSLPPLLSLYFPARTPQGRGLHSRNMLSASRLLASLLLLLATVGLVSAQSNSTTATSTNTTTSQASGSSGAAQPTQTSISQGGDIIPGKLYVLYTDDWEFLTDKDGTLSAMYAGR